MSQSVRDLNASPRVQASVVLKTPWLLFTVLKSELSADAFSPSGNCPICSGLSLTNRTDTMAAASDIVAISHHAARQFPWSRAITAFRVGTAMKPPIPEAVSIKDIARARFL